jgi:hypothetical protein
VPLPGNKKILPKIEENLPRQLSASNYFSGAVAREEVEDFCDGSFHTHILYVVIALLYFIYFTCIVFYQKPKKFRILGSCFYLSAFSFVTMSNPEVEICSFKQ